VHLLQRLQAARGHRDERVGEVLGGVLELTAQRPEMAVLTEIRGSGPPLSVIPAVERSRVYDTAVPGGGASDTESG